MSTARTVNAQVSRGGENVFSDLGFAAEEAEHLRIRSSLMIALRRIVDERKLTQAAAATLFAVTQPRVSDLVRGRIDLFSIDMLVKMLARAGVGVSVSLSPLARAIPAAHGPRPARYKPHAATAAKPA
jgi:predicted XRE-type DNA-binding protein